MVKNAFTPPTECPVCGETVPRDAKACPECGADERSGWNEDDARYDGLDLPVEACGDDDTSGKNSPSNPGHRGTTGWFWLVVAGVLLGLFVLSIFTR